MKMKIAALCLFVFLVAFPCAVYPHPHVWTDYVVHPIFNAQGLEGFRMEWTFDEMFSMQIMEMVDLKRGEPTAKQIRQIREEAFDNLRHHNYFTHVWIDGEKFQIGEARDFTARKKDNRIIYDFFIPCVVKAGNTPRSVLFQVRDPEIFVDLTMSAQNPVRIVKSPGMEVDYQVEKEGSGALGGLFAPTSLNLRFRTSR
jgi:ABC-type uncharacterized transport system substrate-binding protein